MSNQSSVPPAIQASDLMEQIIRVTAMIDLNVEDTFMREQYKTLQQDFIQQLNEQLRDLDLKLTELAKEP